MLGAVRGPIDLTGIEVRCYACKARLQRPWRSKPAAETRGSW